jgi:hypothetical protein
MIANAVSAVHFRCGSNPDSLLGGRTSASAECRHWCERQSVGQAAQFCLARTARCPDHRTNQ